MIISARGLDYVWPQSGLTLQDKFDIYLSKWTNKALAVKYGVSARTIWRTKREVQAQIDAGKLRVVADV